MVEKHRILSQSIAKMLFYNESASLASDIKLNMQSGFPEGSDQTVQRSDHSVYLLVLFISCMKAIQCALMGCFCSNK